MRPKALSVKGLALFNIASGPCGDVGTAAKTLAAPPRPKCLLRIPIA